MTDTIRVAFFVFFFAEAIILSVNPLVPRKKHDCSILKMDFQQVKRIILLLSTTHLTITTLFQECISTREIEHSHCKHEKKSKEKDKETCEEKDKETFNDVEEGEVDTSQETSQLAKKRHLRRSGRIAYRRYFEQFNQ